MNEAMADGRQNYAGGVGVMDETCASDDEFDHDEYDHDDPSVRGVNMVFDAFGKEVSIMAKRKPLGCILAKAVPSNRRGQCPVVQGFEDSSYGLTLGIQRGWVFKSINGRDLLWSGSYNAAMQT